MSSTYSTNLAIELIGNGDQAGTWGTTTNINLGTLIEQAISGIVTQAMADSDQTITIPNGSSGVARNMVIECTGALTAGRSLIVPTNKKLYFIYNNTTGGFAVTVKVSGQTGVSVPNGAKVVLMMNSAGTDIVSATNYQAALTLGSALGVASGGTGAATFTSGALLKGNGASAVSTASAADIVGQIGSTAVTNATNATNATTSTTQSAKDATTAIATTAFADRFRSFFTGSTSGTAAVTDRGCLLIATSSVTVPSATFAANDAFTVINNSASSINVTQGSGVTMYWPGVGSGTRTLGARGVATVIFVDASTCYIIGGNLS